MERPEKLSQGTRKLKTNNYIVCRYTFIFFKKKKRYTNGYTRKLVSQAAPLYTTVFIVNFQQVSQIPLVFLLLILSK